MAAGSAPADAEAGHVAEAPLAPAADPSSPAGTPTGDDERHAIAALYGALAPAFTELEDQRLALRRKAFRLLLSVAGALAVVGVLAMVGAFGRLGGIAVGVGAFIGLAAWGIAMNGPQQAYRGRFKHEIVGRLVAHRYPDATFEPYVGIGIDEFRASRLFRQSIDRYNAEDLIVGRLGATDLRISEVHAEYKTTTTDSKGRPRTQWHTIFRGVLCIADFHKHFGGTTLVVPDGAEGFFGSLGRRLQSLGRAFSDAKLVELEDPEFERAFAVYGTDQVEARYILSTSLMRRLLDFRTRMDASVHLAFIDERVYVAVSSGTNHFEPPSIWSARAAVDEADLAAYLNQVGLAEDVVESLNLNTRIWTKA